MVAPAAYDLCMTWNDPEAAAAWTRLRATRADPPGPAASDPRRRAVYVAALEQAEQLFRSAGGSDVASRPLTVFYGLSQAGRALAAASPKAWAGDWELIGHGLQTPDLTKPLPKVPVVQFGSDKSSFIRLSKLLGSPPIPAKGSGQDPVTVEDLWDAIPEAQSWPVRPDPDRRPVLCVCSALHPDPHPLATVSVVGFPSWVDDPAARAANFRTYMAAFPHAAGYSVVHTRSQDREEPDLDPADGGLRAIMHWETGIDRATAEQRYARLLEFVTPYNDDLYLTPVIGGNTEPMHPLMSWWALLFTLSMLARYQPGDWTAMIDVNASPHAVPLEALLDAALVAVPRLVYSTLRQL